ncbi:MAG: LacI family DNA-binding transcriptional regulator [Christensenella sp.]|uniref:LacI family DNA-binding transcriptional regulator n=1 Tax=Christensenella sp. TaxID=1935934 RepID=UPI002B20B9EC|nr:LacI family DNA-binding transcriptional regulator [Christensenella sp.]MEA5002809.1 LacI family DNA-binding transcriptional regulator [Christensenella sp.]
MTIKQIAELAGVSIATVSHVVNKTRYVSPDLVRRVERVIHETGYVEKIKTKGKNKNFRIGRKSEVAFVVPNINSVVYARLNMALAEYLREEGYVLSAYITKDDPVWEKHVLNCLMADKCTAGIFLTPSSEKAKIYEKLLKTGTPLLCLERTVAGIGADSILAENAEGTYRGTRHLIRSGHEKIGLLLEPHGLSTSRERLAGYQRALREYDIAYDKSMVRNIDLYAQERSNIFQGQKWENIPSALLAGGNTLTLKLLQDLDEIGMECPKDISVVGFGDDEWSSVTNPALTTLTQDTREMARCAVRAMLDKMEGRAVEEPVKRIPVNITVRKSTRVINRGPFGEIAVPTEEIMLSEVEAAHIEAGNYKVAISFHYTGTEWTRLHELAIRDTLGKYGVQVISVMDANFDPALQVTQLEAIRMQRPDAIIGVPADENITAGKFKDLSKTTKLVLIGNVPQGLRADDYYSCVSVNERENGQNAGKILGEYLKGKGNVKVGMLNHGLPFHMTKQRDTAAEQVLVENYPDIEIVDQRSFYKIPNAYSACKDMMEAHPQIQGLYVSWERPALEAIRALKDIGRADVSVVTVDLDKQIAEYMQKGEIVRGVSAQRPYEQGEAAALAVIHALLGKKQYKFIGVQPIVVLPKELVRAWRDILRMPAPDFLKK